MATVKSSWVDMGNWANCNPSLHGSRVWLLLFSWSIILLSGFAVLTSGAGVTKQDKAIYKKLSGVPDIVPRPSTFLNGVLSWSGYGLGDAPTDELSDADAHLCGTIFSAVIQGYPPPVLVGYREEEGDPLGFAGLLDAFLRVLSDYRLRVREKDVILWLGSGPWIQLPVEVTIRRYLQQREVINLRLARRYPFMNIHQGVLFPVAKSCPYEWCNDTDVKRVFSESTLPRDTYGPLEDDLATTSKFSRPRFIMPAAFIGEARDIVALLKAALKLSGPNEMDLDGSSIWGQLFLRQEQRRQAQPDQGLKQNQTAFQQPSDVISGIFHGQEQKHTHNDTDQAADPDLGIHLDYESRLFQALEPLAANDIHLLTLDRPIIAHSPSRSAAHLYRTPLQLPPELAPSLSPFAHINTTTTPLSQANLNHLQKETQYSTLPFLTNTAVPRGSISSILLPSSQRDAAEWWDKMWFRQPGHGGRVLLHDYLHPNRAALALEARTGATARGGRTGWWNDRGGRGGVWTDLGGF
ncbi:hypothetical protein B0T25DRAFT_573029 [Lasiosphaeria hispida]|uniref:Uncharacterized protein n=1 Tax=Lasiosphaeria hispida TaxID=260671 RepID=A0AAJ0H974_9PEZI|nr:hypothetical protein B0T25DRAFT_573029 [Lasiosphaeria hispida]